MTECGLPPGDLQYLNLKHLKCEPPYHENTDTEVYHSATHPGQYVTANPCSPSVDVECGQSRRRKRTRFNPEQLNMLEGFFQRNMYPDIKHRDELAKLLYIPEERIQVWFQNRRAKAKRSGKAVDGPDLVEHFPVNPDGYSVLRLHRTVHHQRRKRPKIWWDMLNSSKQNLLSPSPPNVDLSLVSCAITSQSPPVPDTRQVSPEASFQNDFHMSRGQFNRGQISYNWGTVDIYNNTAPVLEFDHQVINLTRGNASNLMDFNNFLTV